MTPFRPHQRGRWPTILCTLALAGPARGGDPFERFDDPLNDALVRRTDPGGNGPLNPGQTLPDLLACVLSNWYCPTPATDPFAGYASNSPTPHLFRIDLEFAGLVNPPGPLDISGSHDPFRYGPSPLYGFLEINTDRDRDTGGEPLSEALSRYLANVARFGALPPDSINNRVVTRSGQTLLHNFLDAPQFELSGAEFALKLCGCEALTIVSASSPGDAVFSAGDTWIVRARFFERSPGFVAISRMNLSGGVCADPGRYSPVVNLRFSHNATSNRTTVSLVYALDQAGAGLLAGLPFPPPANMQVECDGNSGSIFEALQDIADAAQAAQQTNSWPTLFARTIAGGLGEHADDIDDYLDPTQWRVTALFGTAYSDTISVPSPEDALYVWTDAGFGLTRGDIDGNGAANSVDRDMIPACIAARDGGPDDADGVVDGVVTVPGHAPEFDIHDLDGDGHIDSADSSLIGASPTCRGDWNLDNQLTVQDIFDFLEDWFVGDGDSNNDRSTTLQDIFDYLVKYFDGCG